MYGIHNSKILDLGSWLDPLIYIWMYNVYICIYTYIRFHWISIDLCRFDKGPPSEFQKIVIDFDTCAGAPAS